MTAQECGEKGAINQNNVNKQNAQSMKRENAENILESDGKS